MAAVWYFWLPLLCLLTVLTVMDRVMRRRARKAGKSADDSHFWRAVHDMRRDLKAYNDIGGTGIGVGVDWMAHRRR
jgi:hypothetical protein